MGRDQQEWKMKARALFFTAPETVEVRQVPVPELAQQQLQIQSIVSAISPGTESLLYHGLAPNGMKVDENIQELDGEFSFPFQYGYASVGRVIRVGPEVPDGWQNRLVFCFHPHQSCFNLPYQQAIPIPEGSPIERSVFLPNMETAIGLVHDGAPRLGERVVIFGQGIVGLLTTALLSCFSLDLLAAVEPRELRRTFSLEAGASHVVEDISREKAAGLFEILDQPPGGADLIFELSGYPEVLNDALILAGYESRIVIGSWYGGRQAPLDLGGRFHRDRVRLISSQVSTVAPELRGRWSKSRRFDAAFKSLDMVQPERWITHRFPIDSAEQAYKQLARSSADTVQILFTYEDE
jgi:threonine dehydrogenase-like Zn-dependent dehydrogenase